MALFLIVPFLVFLQDRLTGVFCNVYVQAADFLGVLPVFLTSFIGDLVGGNTGINNETTEINTRILFLIINKSPPIFNLLDCLLYFLNKGIP